MAKLTNEQKLIIIKGLATFSPYTDIQGFLKDAHGVDVSFSQIANYNPDVSGSHVSKRLREVFDSERDKYLNDIEGLPITYSGYRIKTLDRYRQDLEAKGETFQASSVVMQIDKIMARLEDRQAGRQSNAGANPGFSPTFQQINNHIYTAGRQDNDKD